MSDNGIFRKTDPKISELAGFRLPSGWWSRGYEYPWALQFAAPGQVVADMGCGYTYRPFKDALTETCAHVYAVDANPKVLELPARPRLEYVVADMAKPIPAIASNSLDRIFCISVLEDAQKELTAILAEFARCLKPGGLVALTFDTPYELAKPCPEYPGLNIETFTLAARAAGLALAGSALDLGRENTVHHEAWNLCVVHCLLRLPK